MFGLLQPAGFDWTPVYEVLRDMLVLVVPALGAYLAWQLRENTKLTERVEKQTNGRLKTLEEKLATERDKTIGLLGVTRNYRDLLAYLQAQHPEIAPTIIRWRDRRTAPVRAEDMEALAERLAETPPESRP